MYDKNRATTQHNTHIILIKQSFLKVTDQFLNFIWQLGEGLLVPACLHVYMCPQNGHRLIIDLSEAFRRLVGPTVRRVNNVDDLSLTSSCLFVASNPHSLSAPALQRQSVSCFSTLLFCCCFPLCFIFRAFFECLSNVTFTT